MSNVELPDPDQLTFDDYEGEDEDENDDVVVDIPEDD